MTEQQQAAVNSPQYSTDTKATAGGGAPSAISEEAKREMRREAVKAMTRWLDEPEGHEFTRNDEELSTYICKIIYQNKIPHVRFYENN